jgi:hypothetical protein
MFTCEGSWKTTRSIGRECTAGDRRSRPVLTANRLTTPIRSPRLDKGACRPDRAVNDLLILEVTIAGPLKDVASSEMKTKWWCWYCTSLLTGDCVIDQRRSVGRCDGNVRRPDFRRPYRRGHTRSHSEHGR